MRFRRIAALAAAGLVALPACSISKSSTSSTDSTQAAEPSGDCTVVDVAVSSEKVALMAELAKQFNDSADSKVNGKCSFVRSYGKASGGAAQLLVDGWPDPDTNGNRPTIWSPAASGWGAIVNQRTNKPIAVNAQPFMLTPLVIAMPKPMADALGYPGKPIGYADIVSMAKNPEGWAAFGHPEWGPFRLGKTNPNFSTSGLNFTVAEYYAATGKSSGLTVEDLRKPDVQQFASDVESAVVHYGDTTMTFLNNWYRADARSTALTYASAVAIEEKSVIDYNAGNPDGVVDPGEEPRAPNIPLVAVYPSDGTLFSDNPLFVLDADWVTADQKAAANAFSSFVRQPENQQKVLQYGFRPGNPAVPLAEPIVLANGVDPNEPQAELEVPKPEVLTGILDSWATNRKDARVLLVLDVSGSMGDDGGNGVAKLELAKQATITALDEFKDDDDVGLWIFTTDIEQIGGAAIYQELSPVGPIGATREAMKSTIRNLQALNGTPLYDVTAQSFEAMRAGYDPTKINAVVLLTDGVNDDGKNSDDESQLDSLIKELRGGSEGANSQPVRIFTISYGADADKATLKRIAEASNAALYDASDPRSINRVFTAVVSNF